MMQDQSPIIESNNDPRQTLDDILANIFQELQSYLVVREKLEDLIQHGPDLLLEASMEVGNDAMDFNSDGYFGVGLTLATLDQSKLRLHKFCSVVEIPTNPGTESDDATPGEDQEFYLAPMRPLPDDEMEKNHNAIIQKNLEWKCGLLNQNAWKFLTAQSSYEQALHLCVELANGQTEIDILYAKYEKARILLDECTKSTA